MKSLFIIVFIITTVAYLIFFGIFNVDIEAQKGSEPQELYLITDQQIDYIADRGQKFEEVIVSDLSKSLAKRNTLWSDSLAILSSETIQRMDVELSGDFGMSKGSKRYSFYEIPMPYWSGEYSGKDILPKFSELFYFDMPFEKIKLQEEVIRFKDGVDMNYFIQGPVSSRAPEINKNPGMLLDIANTDIKAKFRFWVNKDGRINQVVVEEGSPFTLVNAKITNLIKTWNFSPIRDPEGPAYQWGVVNIKVQR